MAAERERRAAPWDGAARRIEHVATVALRASGAAPSPLGPRPHQPCRCRLPHRPRSTLRLVPCPVAGVGGCAMPSAAKLQVRPQAAICPARSDFGAGPSDPLGGLLHGARHILSVPDGPPLFFSLRATVGPPLRLWASLFAGAISNDWPWAPPALPPNPPLRHPPRSNTKPLPSVRFPPPIMLPRWSQFGCAPSQGSVVELAKNSQQIAAPPTCLMATQPKIAPMNLSRFGRADRVRARSAAEVRRGARPCGGRGNWGG